MRILMRGAVLGVAPALLLAATLLAPALSVGAQASRTLVFGQSGDAVKLDPALIEDGLSARVTQQIFEGLVAFDGATTRIEPSPIAGKPALMARPGHSTSVRASRSRTAPRSTPLP
jgi:ABC-type transport system substrate-binding protein